MFPILEYREYSIAPSREPAINVKDVFLAYKRVANRLAPGSVVYLGGKIPFHISISGILLY